MADDEAPEDPFGGFGEEPEVSAQPQVNFTASEDVVGVDTPNAPRDSAVLDTTDPLLSSEEVVMEEPMREDDEEPPQPPSLGTPFAGFAVSSTKETPVEEVGFAATTPRAEADSAAGDAEEKEGELSAAAEGTNAMDVDGAAMPTASGCTTIPNRP